jgi:hypothetical protein
MKNLLTATFLTVSLAISSAWAGPTAQLKGGNTTVELSPDFVGALVSLGVAPAATKPGKLKLDKGTVSFPIPSGALDAESLAGDIFHTGGLVLSVPGTRVDLLNFIISTTGENPVLTGVASVNGDVVDRIPLFDLDLDTAEVDVTKKNKLTVTNVGVTLNAIAAATLNSVFGTDAFVEGFPIGTASVETKIKRALGGDE